MHDTWYEYEFDRHTCQPRWEFRENWWNLFVHSQASETPWEKNWEEASSFELVQVEQSREFH
jgi:hypothetical protein